MNAMALSSQQLTVTAPVSPVVKLRARASNSRFICNAARQPAQSASRRESLGLLLALPLLASGQQAHAAELTDFRKVKGEHAPLLRVLG